MRKAIARAHRLVYRTGPDAVKEHDFGATHEAVAPIRHDVRLRGAPVGERAGPFLGATEVADLEARLDHAAVHGPRDGGRDLACRHAEHHFVEERQAPGRLTAPDQHPAAALSRQADEIDVAEAIADAVRFDERFVPGGEIAARDRTERNRQQQVTALDAIVLSFVQQSARFGQPARRARAFGLRPAERQPEGAARRANGVSLIQEPLVCANHRACGFRVSGEQIGRHRELFQIGRVESGVGVRLAEVRERLLPGVARERRSASLQRIRTGPHSSDYAATVGREKSNRSRYRALLDHRRLG